MNEFRFSPRPNRAAEIGWMPWGADAFARATSEDKPILLSISAVWCHWCHVMDETSYSDARVIHAINRHFVPIRVDNDRRPDVNARYNMGGWPTTAFLAPDGTTITGATYIPPEQFARALEEVARFYVERKDEIAARGAQLRERGTEPIQRPGELDESPITDLTEQLERAYDEDFGGFGEAPKFPQPEALEFLLTQWRYSGNQRCYEMVAKTVLAMARGGMYDHVEGGFFRYSTTRDWSVPHFEKMSEDHAGLLRVLSQLALFSANDEFRTTLASASGYVRHVLRDPQTGLFAGSQDADEAYYELALEERRKREAPYVDRTSYTNWTAALAGSLALASRALNDDRLVSEAMQTLDELAHSLTGRDALLYHVFTSRGRPEVCGLLVDQVAYVRASLDVYETSGESRFLERARHTCDAIVEKFAAPEGGFYDRLPGDETLGRLVLTDVPLVDNGLLAESLLRLASLTDEAIYRERAERILRFFMHGSRAAGAFAAPYARALQRFLAPELTVRVVGSATATQPLRETALRLPSPFVATRTLSPHDAAAFAMPSDEAAYVCVTGRCGPPVRSAAELRAAYDALTATLPS